MTKKIIAIFASYDDQNTIPEYVETYLKELHHIADIVFVSDNSLSPQAIQKITPYTIHHICQHHGKYDFGSYQLGYQYLIQNNLIHQYQALILCNDSVFGPFYPLSDIIQQMNSKNCDFWGVFHHAANTDRKIPEHIQSYFIYLPQKLASSSLLQNFFNSISQEQDKQKIIDKYEIGLSQLLIKHGYHCEGLLSAPYNQPQTKDAIAIIKQGFPFLKKSLFNPNLTYNFTLPSFNYCQQLYTYPTTISSISPDYPVKQIETYLLQKYGTLAYHKHLHNLRFYLLQKLKNFFYQKKIKKGKMLTKICKITVHSKKI